MIIGLSCGSCGIYFDEKHGFPVLCEDCFEESSGVSVLPMATIEEL